MTKKIKILVFIGCYIPAYKAGGPVCSLANLVVACGDDLDFRIVTSDRDLGDPAPFADIVCGEWMSVGKASVLYLSPEMQNYKTVKQIINTVDCDMIYLNGMWDPCWIVYPLLANYSRKGKRLPVVQAVRGMLGDAAMDSHFLRKKLLLFLLYKLRGCAKKVVFQCSSSQELNEVRKYFGDDARAEVVLNVPGSDIVEKSVSYKKPGKINLVFISRIIPKKNLHGALAALALVKAEVNFAIYGTIPDKQYWDKCQVLMKSLPANIQVDFMGELASGDVVDRLSQYDCMFFPTNHENFGHVIHESLRAAVPVITSNNVPWQQLVDSKCGWQLAPDDYRGQAGLIDELAVLSAEKWSVYKTNALELARRYLLVNNIIDDNMNLFIKAKRLSVGKNSN